jgi:hypothetical protein
VRPVCVGGTSGQTLDRWRASDHWDRADDVEHRMTHGRLRVIGRGAAHSVSSTGAYGRYEKRLVKGNDYI